MKFVATKKRLTKFFFSSLSFLPVFGSEIRDPGSRMGKNQDPGSGINIPDTQHCKESIPSANVACQASTVRQIRLSYWPARAGNRFIGSLKALQIRDLQHKKWGQSLFLKPVFCLPFVEWRDWCTAGAHAYYYYCCPPSPPPGLCILSHPAKRQPACSFEVLLGRRRYRMLSLFGASLLARLRANTPGR